MADTETVVPIRDGMAPAFDGEFEYGEWFMLKLRRFVEERGHAPSGMALVMVDELVVRSETFCPAKDMTHAMVCGLGIASLSRRAFND